MKEGWEYKKIKDVCFVYAGQGAPQGEDKYGNIGIPFIKAGNLCDLISGLGESSIPKVTELVADKHKLKLYSAGSVVFAKSGMSCMKGYVYTLKQDCYIVSHLAILQPKYVLSGYLNYYLRYVKPSSLVKDEAYPSISLKDIENLTILMPPPSIQQSIVSELDEINNLLSLKRKELETYDKLTQSLFYEMFGDPVENEMGWEVKKLGEVGEIITGSTPSTNDESNWDGNVNWVTPAELDIQLYYGETKRKITAKAASSLRLMPIGTVLLSTRAPIGKLAITNVAMCCNQGFKNIICGIFLNNVFLYYYLMLTMDSIKAMGRGATFKEVSKTAISNYRVLLPPLPLQQLFAQRIEAIEEQKVHVKAAIEKLETLLAARMQYWFD